MISISRTDSRGRTITLISRTALSPMQQEAVEPVVPEYHRGEVIGWLHYLQKRPSDPLIVSPRYMVHATS